MARAVGGTSTGTCFAWVQSTVAVEAERAVASGCFMEETDANTPKDRWGPDLPRDRVAGSRLRGHRHADGGTAGGFNRGPGPLRPPNHLPNHSIRGQRAHLQPGPPARRAVPRSRPCTD